MRQGRVADKKKKKIIIIINKRASLLRMRANRGVIIERAGAECVPKKAHVWPPSPRPQTFSRCQYRAGRCRSSLRASSAPSLAPPCRTVTQRSPTYKYRPATTTIHGCTRPEKHRCIVPQTNRNVSVRLELLRSTVVRIVAQQVKSVRRPTDARTYSAERCCAQIIFFYLGKCYILEPKNYLDIVR